MTNDQHNDVSVPCAEYVEMARDWELIDDLEGGTAAMRLAAERWLPKDNNEEDSAYTRRLARSVLYPFFVGAVDRMTSKPFSRELSWSEPDADDGSEAQQREKRAPLPAPLMALLDDVDGAGTTMHELAARVFRERQLRGVTHVLVDHDEMPAGLVTRADQQAAGTRVRLIHTAAPNVIGWQHDPDDGRLLQVRIREYVSQPLGLYGSHVVERIRVYSREGWELWEKRAAKGGKPEWVRVAEGGHSFGAVPLLTFGPGMVARPPHMALAWLNVRHWQSTSDQANIVHWSRIPMLFGSGISPDEALTLGAGKANLFESEKANVRYVEHTGAAIASGTAEIESLESTMRALSWQPLLPRTGDVTATQIAVDSSQTASQIQADARELQSFLREVLVAAGRWIGEKVPDAFSFDVYDDFEVSLRSEADVEALLKARISGEIDRTTYLLEIQRRGLISPQHDVAKIVARLQEEGGAGEPQEPQQRQAV